MNVRCKNGHIWNAQLVWEEDETQTTSEVRCPECGELPMSGTTALKIEKMDATDKERIRTSIKRGERFDCYVKEELITSFTEYVEEKGHTVSVGARFAGGYKICTVNI